LGITVFKTDLKNISSDFDLRVDSKFYELINDKDFLLIEKSKFPLIELRHIIEPDYEEFNFENGKKYKGLPTGAGFFDEEGNIIDYLDVTKEKHPKRIKYRVKEGNVIISSLKGAKATTILATEDKTNYVWSNGFYIFKKINEKFETKYIYYLLKSSKLRAILNENLSRGIGISAYEERDLLRIKIPMTPKENQIRAIKKIEKIEKKISKIKKSIPNVQYLIENVFESELACIPLKELSQKKQTEIFTKQFSDIGKRRYLRSDPKYLLFWDKTRGELFKSKKIRNVKLRNLITLQQSEILKKGELDQKYILIDKEDVEPKTGIILNENEVKKIGSNKIIFGNADILIPKLRPYLGHVFLNEKDKNMIGTPEFLPYCVNKEELNAEYLKYILLSNNFLKLVKFLLSGKEHPRITTYDLESIKIPLPKNEKNQEEQNRLIEIINSSLGNLKQKKQELQKSRVEIEKTIMDSFN